VKLSAPIFRLKRQAKLMARQEAIPLHEAQDRLARDEGFQRWSHLAAHHGNITLAQEVLDQLDLGDLVLLAGKRYQGKTMLAFDLIVEALKRRRSSRLFSLDENGPDIEHRLEAAGVDLAASSAFFSYDTSDEISAAYIIERCSKANSGALIVIDYLQMLDQQRSKPVLADQVEALKVFAERSQSTIVLLSQIDRRFDRSQRTFPDPEDIRLPNPIDLNQFAKTCIIHDGEVKVGIAA